MVETPFLFDVSQLDRLACPACLGRLSLLRDSVPNEAEGHLLCAACSRAYPILEGIPVLIAARAKTTS